MACPYDDLFTPSQPWDWEPSPPFVPPLPPGRERGEGVRVGRA
jgi:hypothetical protein